MADLSRAKQPPVVLVASWAWAWILSGLLSTASWKPDPGRSGRTARWVSRDPRVIRRLSPVALMLCSRCCPIKTLLLFAFQHRKNREPINTQFGRVVLNHCKNLYFSCICRGRDLKAFVAVGRTNYRELTAAEKTNVSLTAVIKGW